MDVFVRKPHNKKLVYVINSFTGYFEVAGARCLRSLLEHGVPKEDIIVIVGGAENAHEEYVDGVLFRYVEHNSSDYTSFIEALDIPNIENWCFIHDTCEVTSEQFDKTVRGIVMSPKWNDFECATFHLLGITNMGVYKHDFLLNIECFLRTLKNTDKFRGIYAETTIPRLGRSMSINCQTAILPPRDIYGNGNPRQTVRFDIGLNKYQNIISNVQTPKLSSYTP